jgi:nitrogen fixation/metabolism regulation signal transduction histidine kinase
MAGIGLFICLQVYLLIHYVNNTNYSLVKFMNALKNGDYSVYFSPTKKGDSFAKVYDDFNAIIKIFKQNKIEKEAQFKYFRYILEHVNLGIISIRLEDLENEKSESEILFLNLAASTILQQPQHKYWHRFAQQVPWFVEEVKKLKEGGKSLVDMSDEITKKQLSLEVVNIQLLDSPYLIITFQDIRSEIEQKEIEAWHNVIRILAHEMLNSFTPVGSLAETIKTLTENDSREIIAIDELDQEVIQDINSAASTIKKRSDGLLTFVNDYRTISNVPVPQKSVISIKQLLNDIMVLMKTSAKDSGVFLKLLPVPPNAFINADSKLIEQVLINLINNSIYALAGRPDPTITLSCSVSPDTSIIEITDNGIGIEESILNQIFIPFFTTRKNGSGIGLSLSKNIMKKHQGNLRVHSEPGVYTTFSLLFKNEA